MDTSAYFDETGLKSPYYRVTAKALVRDDQDRILVVFDNDAKGYELPGGGWDFDESFEDCVRREFKEELGTDVASVGDLLFTYRGRGTYHGEVRKNMMMRIVAEVKINELNFHPDAAEITEAKFVSREEFLALQWTDVEAEILQCVDKIWPSAAPAPATTEAETEKDTATDTVSENDKISL